MFKILSLLMLLMLVSGAISSDAVADTIALKNGQTYEGKITAEEEGRIQIKLETGGARLWFSRDQIAEMEKSPPEEESEGEGAETASSSKESSDEAVDDDVKRARDLLEKWRLESRPEKKTEEQKKPGRKGARRRKPGSDLSAREGDPEEIDALVKTMMSTQAFHIRLKACRKLGEIGGERAIPHLIEALDDKTPGMRKAAITALKKITGTDMNYSPTAPRAVRLDFIKEWKKWWKKRQDNEAMDQLKSLF